MIGTDVAGAGAALLLTVVAGLVAHELSHALVLWLATIEFDVVLFPERTGSVAGLLASCPWAVVTPQPTAADSLWSVRLAALAPVALALPVFTLGIGGSPAIETPIGTGVAIGWLACAIPSPQDFSVAFYADRVLEQESERWPTACGE